MRVQNKKIKVNNQLVRAKNSPVNVSKRLFNRYVSIDKVFDIINIDLEVHYEFKQFVTDDLFWRHANHLNNLYKYNSCFMGFYFKSNNLPKRCESYHKELIKNFTNWLKDNGKTRVSSSKVKLITKHFLKHISRLHYHNKFSLAYTRKFSNWKEYKTLSHEYAMLLIEYLKELGVVRNLTGYTNEVKNNTDNTSSMLIFKPDFIHLCNGKVSSKKGMDECLRTIELPKSLVKIHERYGEGNKLKRERVMTKEEKIVAKDLNAMMKGWTSLLQNSMIEVNGTLIPEIFFIRIFNNDLMHGGRFFDDGSIQQQSKPIRETIKIDQEDTIELDFKSLHYAFAAEELGLNLLHKDPYDFEYSVAICQESFKGMGKYCWY